ncbi:MAG: hypothetical protein JJE22_16240 [Bacteroidia bacterium]|nr:hypothetical protein [Bacteroidia bacterium]
MNNDRNKRIEQILESLDSNQRATAPDFFYTRLKARMQREQEKGRVGEGVFRPAYALAALAIVFIINISIMLGGEKATDTNISDTETAQSIAAEYSLNDNGNLFDLTLDQ